MPTTPHNFDSDDSSPLEAASFAAPGEPKVPATPAEILGFDPLAPMNSLDLAAEAIFDAAVSEDTHSAITKLIDDKLGEFRDLTSNIANAGVLVHWTKFDQDDESTWPDIGESVLGLICWTKGKHYRYGLMGSDEENRERVFYEALYGSFMLRGDLDSPCHEDEASNVVFIRDTEEGDESDVGDIVDRSLPKWWTRLGTPQRLELE